MKYDFGTVCERDMDMLFMNAFCSERSFPSMIFVSIVLLQDFKIPNFKIGVGREIPNLKILLSSSHRASHSRKLLTATSRHHAHHLGCFLKLFDKAVDLHNAGATAVGNAFAARAVE